MGRGAGDAIDHSVNGRAAQRYREWLSSQLYVVNPERYTSPLEAALASGDFHNQFDVDYENDYDYYDWTIDEEETSNDPYDNPGPARRIDQSTITVKSLDPVVVSQTLFENYASFSDEEKLPLAYGLARILAASNFKDSDFDVEVEADYYGDELIDEAHFTQPFLKSLLPQLQALEAAQGDWLKVAALGLSGKQQLPDNVEAEVRAVSLADLPIVKSKGSADSPINPKLLPYSESMRRFKAWAEVDRDPTRRTIVKHLPVAVVQETEQGYQVVDGEARLRACQSAERDPVQVIVLSAK